MKMESKLLAGFARVDITPKKASVPLGGLGASEYRLAAVVQDPLNVNAFALGDGTDRCVFLSVEILWIPTALVAFYRETITEATGVPEDRSGFRDFSAGTLRRPAAGSREISHRGGG